MRRFRCTVLTWLPALLLSMLPCLPASAAPESGWGVGDAVVVLVGDDRVAGVVRDVAPGTVTVVTEHGRLVVGPEVIEAQAVREAVLRQETPLTLPPRGERVLLQSTDKMTKRKLEYLGRAWGDVEPIETKHYIVMCNSTQEVAERYANMLEALFDKYNSVFKNFNPTQTEKSRVWIHANHQQFMDWTGNEPGVGGFYSLLRRDVTAYHGSFGSTGTTYEVLAHEGTHQFQGFTVAEFNAMPRWLAEGLAVFFGDGSELKGFGKNLDVEIGKIPRDRLLTLQSLMRNTELWKPETFMLWGPNYPGIGYAPAWGIVYWCLWGNKKVKGQDKAYSGNSGPMVLKDFFEPITQNTEMVDLQAELKRFQQLIVEHTKYTSYEDWRDDYKDWIMTLKVDQLFARRGTMWVSEGLGCEVPKVSGWGKVPPEESYGNQEAIAFQKRGSQMRRIATWFWANSDRDELSIDLIKAIHDNSFNVQKSHFDDTEMEGVEDGFKVHKNESGAIVKIEARFTGKVGRRTDALGTGEDEEKKADADKPREVWVVYRASLEKIYANLLEADASGFEGAKSTFERYDDRFKIR